MSAEDRDVGQQIGAALEQMDHDACRDALALGAVSDGELMQRLTASGADIPRLLVAATGTAVLQGQVIQAQSEAIEEQRRALDLASDTFKRLRSQLQAMVDSRTSETADDHVDALKGMLARMDPRT